MCHPGLTDFMENKKKEPDEESLKWEDFFGSSLDLVPILLNMYDSLVAQTPTQSPPAVPEEVEYMDAAAGNTLDSGFVDQQPWSKGDKRPLSISSTSSSSSSSNLCPKKSAYLASIESLEDDLTDDETRSVKEGPSCITISSPCPPTTKPKYCDPNLSYTDRVVMEIIETERTYVADLHQIITGYLGFVKEGNFCIKDEDIKDLFGNIEEIHRFNSGFLKDLELCGLDPVSVAKCFVQHNEGFTIYTHYCTNYPRTVTVLTDLMRQKNTAEIFREHQAALGHTLPLGSFLLKPVQRILKYHLLLQNIVKHYDHKKAGYDVIVNALATMTGMAHHINDMKRKHEHAVRVQEIQSLLYGWEGHDLTTYGELVAEGTFRIFGAKAIRHVFLFDKMLLITKKKEGGYLSYKTHIMCSNLMLIESIPGEPLCFHVIPFDNPKIQYTLQSRSLEQKREWTLQLKRVILENYHAEIPYHARQLVMQLGQNRPEDENFIEKGNISKRQHSAPEYLEKRKHEKERRKSEGGGINRALRIRKGGRKSDTESATSPVVERRIRNNHSSSRDSSLSRLTDDKSNKPTLETNKKKVKEKKSKGWRRKSEPSDFMSSKESLVANPSPVKSNERSLDYARPRSTPETPCNISQTDWEGSYHEALNTIESMLNSNRNSRSAAPSYSNCHWNHSNSNDLNDLNEEDPTADYVTFYFAQQHIREHPVVTVNHSLNYPGSPTQVSSSSSNYQLSPTQVSSSSSNYQLSPSSTSASEFCLATSSCEKQPSPNRPNTANSNYDNLLNIWTGIGWLNLEKTESSQWKESCSSVRDHPPFIRRALSFNSHSRSQNNAPNQCRQSLPNHPNKLNLNPPSLPVSPDSVGSPTAPSVWLKQQREHFAEGHKKSGSLPRSFQLGVDQKMPHHASADCSIHEMLKLETNYNYGLRNDLRSLERPVTIASENALQSNLNLEDFEQYIQKSPSKHYYKFPVSREESEERSSTTGCTSTPAESCEDISGNFHPEHRIYRSSFSKSSIKNMITNVSSKLSHLKLGLQSEASSCSNINLNFKEPERGRPLTRNHDKDKIANKLVCSVAKMYSKMIKQRVKLKNYEREIQTSPALLPPMGLPFYRQGSPAIGARMASPYQQSEYSIPRCQIQKRDEVRPDSVLSVSSNLTSSSDGDKTSGVEGSLDVTATPCESTVNLGNINETVTCVSNKNREEGESDGSADSYYERSFEAIENFLETEMFRDSAIYSDPEDVEPNEETDRRKGQRSPKPKKKGQPPPKPAKPKLYDLKPVYTNSVSSDTDGKSVLDNSSTRKVRGQCILEKLKHLEECSQYQKDDATPTSPTLGAFKTIEERRRELEQWNSGSPREMDESETSSQHSSSTINTIVEVPIPSTSNNHTSMKGWVKHVVGKFQEKANPDNTPTSPTKIV